MTSGLAPGATVCALVPHFECGEWLAGALESLHAQTRPPDAVVVIDDASAEPPVDIVRGFPDVTLLVATDNGGPYRLVQAVIDASDYDAYLFQDADDWSAADRLEALLDAAGAAGAGLVGSHEVRVMVDQGDMVPVRYPLDVNAVLDRKPAAFPLLHPTSLVSRDLVTGLGGFATGMRFSGDAEFLRRAGHAARVVNADHFGYFRRKRAGSLTTAPGTALQSPQRRRVQETLAARALANAELVARGRRPDLAPWKLSDPPTLRHETGPALGARRTTGRRAARRGPAHRRAGARPTGEAVFVIGPPRAGQAMLGWGLGQHPSFHALPDARWLARAATDITARAREEAAPPPAPFVPAMAAGLASAADDRTGRRPVAAGGEVTDAAWSLAGLFPNSRFVFLSRDAAEAVADLLALPTEGGTFYTADLAYRHWASGTRVGLDLEAALGTDRVLRLDHADLVDGTEAALRRCLRFLGCRYSAACLRPLVGLERAALPPVEPSLPLALAEEVSALSDRLAAPPAGPPDPAAAERLERASPVAAGGAEGTSLVEKVRALVGRAVPDGAVVVVASKGDPRLVDLPRATGWHYPQVDGGTYAGHHPADSASAVAQLEDLRARGGEYLALPASGFWWLSHYRELREHLERSARVVAYQDDAGVVYRLADPEQAGTAGPVPGLEPAVSRRASELDARAGAA